jgi:hypothetical protein
LGLCDEKTVKEADMMMGTAADTQLRLGFMDIDIFHLPMVEQSEG